MPKDNKGYTTLKDMIEGIVKYICKDMDYKEHFDCDELMDICTLIFEELFTNKNGYGYDYRFWLYDHYQLLNIATNSLYIKYKNDDEYGGLHFPCYERDDDKILLDKIDKYLKDNNRYELEPHDFDHMDKWLTHLIDYINSDEVGQILDSILKNNPPN